jgi:hypothetical protein
VERGLTRRNVRAKIRSHLSYANVMASIALFVALGGSSYAALRITGSNVKDSSLTGRDIARNSVTGADIKSLGSADIKDGSLLARDFKPGELSDGSQQQGGGKGEKGDPGAPGPAGARGNAGPAGSSSNVLASGSTLRGVFALAAPADAAGDAVEGSIHFNLSSAPTAHYIQQGSTPPAQCPGSPAAPEAQAGHLCVYEAGSDNAGNRNVFNPVTNADATATANGAGLYVFAAGNTPFVLIRGSWAVTAP